LTLGLDLRDLGSPDLSWRRFRAVISFLPSTSATARSIHGDGSLWTAAEHLLASTVDALNAANWQRGGGKGRKPAPVPRPGDESRGKKLGTGRMSVAEARVFFDRVNRGQALGSQDATVDPMASFTSTLETSEVTPLSPDV
jgi:hypothetical protein